MELRRFLELFKMAKVHHRHHCHNRNYPTTKLHLMQGTRGEEGAEVEEENVIKEMF